MRRGFGGRGRIVGRLDLLRTRRKSLVGFALRSIACRFHLHPAIGSGYFPGSVFTPSLEEFGWGPDRYQNAGEGRLPRTPSLALRVSVGAIGLAAFQAGRTAGSLPYASVLAEFARVQAAME